MSICDSLQLTPKLAYKAYVLQNSVETKTKLKLRVRWDNLVKVYYTGYDANPWSVLF